MPAARHASISSVPAGTVTFLPSTVRFTSAMNSLSCALGAHQLDQRLRLRRRWICPDVLLELVAEFFEEADHRHGRGVAERAEGAPQHVFGEVAHIVDVLRGAVALVEARHGLLQPVGALTAGDAP